MSEFAPFLGGGTANMQGWTFQSGIPSNMPTTDQGYGVWAAQPLPPTSQLPGTAAPPKTPGFFTAENLQALAEAAKGVSGLAAGIAGRNQARAEARMAKMIARENANRVYRRLRAVAERGMAIAGGQGTTLAGNPLLTYGANLNEANLAAATELFQGEGQAIALKEEGRQRLRKGVYDFGEGAAKAFYSMRPGTALLRRP